MTEPATKPCTCRNGTVTDSNGAAWRCAHCNGTGVVPDVDPSLQVEEVEW
jgi:DnaJ-class molecular chaperone